MVTSASIIICTCNRSASLMDTLQSIGQMIVPRGIDWEVLVVDNNSTDDTAKKVEEFAKDGHITVRYLFEPKQGKANALNRGIGNALGEILVFTDDDALVDRLWLGLIIDTFNDLTPDCVGGKVLPLWLGPRPRWLTDRLLNVLAVLDFGDAVYELNEEKDEMLYGVNFAFKRDFFLRHGTFNVDLCSRGAGNEDHELFERLKRAKGKAIYHPEVVVQHKIFPERLRKSYFRRWHYLVGKDRAKLSQESRLKVFGIEGYMLRNFVTFAGRYLLSVLSLDRDSIFFYELKLVLYFSFFESRLMK
jgi:glucosyl-dolichyl phosphate glucuronosyltransferase